MNDQLPYQFGLPENPQFSQFVTTDGLLPHEISRIDDLWDAEQSAPAGVAYGDSVSESNIRKSSIIAVGDIAKYRWIFDRLATAVSGVNSQFYGFDIQGFFEPLQLAEYGEGDFFDWHLDFGEGSASNRKLSITVQLSDPDSYEGGNLEFMLNNDTVAAPREQGTVVVFPSFITHRVTPLTKGVRRSIVGWIGGPPYR